MKLTIGELANLFKISAHTLRFYDEKGLVIPDKDPVNGYRYYSLKHIEQLEQVLFFRSFDISIEEIKEQLERSNLTSISDMLDTNEQLIEKKIRSLEMKQRKIKHIRRSIQSAIEQVGMISTAYLPCQYGVYFDSEVSISEYKKVSHQIDYDWLIHSTNTNIFKKDDILGEYLWGHSSEDPLKLPPKTFRKIGGVEAKHTAFIGTLAELRTYLNKVTPKMEGDFQEILVFELIHFMKKDELQYVYEIWFPQELL